MEKEFFGKNAAYRILKKPDNILSGFFVEIFYKSEFYPACFASNTN